MSSQWGRKLRLTLFGESHGSGVGAVLDGFPAGMPVNTDAVTHLLARRAPARNAFSTSRREPDVPSYLSGLTDGVTNGAPLSIFFENKDARPVDYNGMEHSPRPGHADYPASVRYGGHADLRGGGHFSGRLTAPLVAAGALCLQWCVDRGVTIGAHLARVGSCEDTLFDPVHLSRDTLLALTEKAFPTLDEGARVQMEDALHRARDNGDSLGGVVECAAVGLQAGLGEPCMDGLDAALGALLFSIPACKGVEFGDGFALAGMQGSQANDAYRFLDGHVVTDTNRAGGLLGGMTTGMPLVFRAAFKPTPSIAQPQQTVHLPSGQPHVLTLTGRHDACVAIRAVPAVEAACALVLMDAML